MQGSALYGAALLFPTDHVISMVILRLGFSMTDVLKGATKGAGFHTGKISSARWKRVAQFIFVASIR